jgi:hypothetical protein
MPLASDRQVNEKPFEIGINLQKSAGFHPLSWEKTALKVAIKVLAWIGPVALTIASLVPGDEMVRTGMNGGIEHEVAYMLTAGALMLAYPDRPAWYFGAALSAYAAVLEFGQLVIPGRHPAISDWMAGVIGTAIAWSIVVWWRHLIFRRSRGG